MVWNPGNPKEFGPGAWSWFHIIWLIICVASSVLIVIFLSKRHDKKLELLITRIMAVVFVLLELAYQIVAIVYNGSFKFKNLPFNTCSLPIYFTVISAFLTEKHAKAKEIVDRTNIAFCLIGGIGMMVMPSYPLNTPYVLRSLHTMLWHTLLVCYGVYMFFSKELYKDSNIKSIIPFVCILMGIVIVGTIINESVYYGYLFPNKIDKDVDSANYFFISKHYDTPIPILSSLQGKIPFMVFLLLFIVLFTGIVLALKYASFLVYFLINKYILKKETKLVDSNNN